MSRNDSRRRGLQALTRQAKTPEYTGPSILLHLLLLLLLRLLLRPALLQRTRRNSSPLSRLRLVQASILLLLLWYLARSSRFPSSGDCAAQR